MSEKLEIDTKRMISAIVLSILVLIAAQLVALFAGDGAVALGAHEAMGNVIAAILYPLFTLFGLKAVCNKVLKLSLEDCRISKYKIKPIWGISAILMPALVVAGFLLVSGHWENPPMSQPQLANALTGAILFIGLAAGFVEEAVFRGVIMKVLEIRWNKKIAILAPSILFAALHVIGTKMNLLSFFQLIIAGSAVGILFSLVTYESRNIWSSALMHSLWNMCMGSGILYISSEMSPNSIFNYVLHSNSFLLTGGDFGIEASCISIAAYLIFILIALILLRRKHIKFSR